MVLTRKEVLDGLRENGEALGRLGVVRLALFPEDLLQSPVDLVQADRLEPRLRASILEEAIDAA